MKLNTDIKKLKNFKDIQQLKSVVKSFNSEWDEWNFRQKNYYFPHKNTESIPFFWSTDQNIIDGVFNVISYNSQNIILKMINDDLLFFTKKYEGSICKLMLSKLKKQKNIMDHVDCGFLLTESHRLHLPIITNKNVIFNIENCSYNMLEGIWYEFDNTRSHSVENNSNDDRIHLMLDIIPNNILKSNNIKINYISR
jgi:hypothetical protein